MHINKKRKDGRRRPDGRVGGRDCREKGKWERETRPRSGAYLHFFYPVKGGGEKKKKRGRAQGIDGSGADKEIKNVTFLGKESYGFGAQKGGKKKRREGTSYCNKGLDHRTASHIPNESRKGTKRPTAKALDNKKEENRGKKNNQQRMTLYGAYQNAQGLG